ncbi:MAG: hypothetical protein RIB98_07420 [Acidimicrobiales bacterium]
MPNDEIIDAVGKVTEALETIERARGRLYDFHQLTGHADAQLGEAADRLEDAGATDLAEELRESIVGRNVIEGRWTFQIVEEYDETYWEEVRAFERRTRDELLDGTPHLHESNMKERRRTHGRRHHEAQPGPGH